MEVRKVLPRRGYTREKEETCKIEARQSIRTRFLAAHGYVDCFDVIETKGQPIEWRGTSRSDIADCETDKSEARHFQRPVRFETDRAEARHCRL